MAMEQANAAFVEEHFDQAVQLYSEVLAAEPENAVALASRAHTYLRLHNHELALQDADKACAVDPKYEVAFYRKGVAAFNLGKYGEAKAAFEAGLALLGGQDNSMRKYQTWLRKCQAELEDAGGAAAGASEKENDVPTVVAAAGSSSSSSSSSAGASSGASKPLSPTPEPSVRYQYYQSATHVTVTVLQKGLKEEDARVTIEPRRLTVALRREDGREAVVLDKPLFDAILPEESSSKVLSTKIEIKLKKASAYQWGDLTGTGTGPAGPSPATTAATAAPSAGPTPVAATAPAGQGKAPRPYASQKDWEQVEREITKELEQEKPEGEEALNKLFQDIYAKASDETRRAMVKSFQTSGGTVLSTNWEEVAKKDYEKEREAPEGMEWRKWG